MRLCAIWSSSDEPVAERALQLCLERLKADRVFLLGEAAAAGARRAAREKASADDRFLQAAADYLLQDDDGPPPVRAAPPLLSSAVVVGPPPDRPPLVRMERAVELLGPHVCIVAGDAKTIAPGEAESAQLWIAGGAPRGVTLLENRPVLSPGDLARGEGVLLLEATAQEAQVSFLDPAGAVLERAALPLSSSARITVQG